MFRGAANQNSKFFRSSKDVVGQARYNFAAVAVAGCNLLPLPLSPRPAQISSVHPVINYRRKAERNDQVTSTRIEHAAISGGCKKMCMRSASTLRSLVDI